MPKAAGAAIQSIRPIHSLHCYRVRVRTVSSILLLLWAPKIIFCVSVCEYMCIEIYIFPNNIHGSSYGLRGTEISIRTHISLNQSINSHYATAVHTQHSLVRRTKITEIETEFQSL
jgi:hypothetical protein